MAFDATHTPSEVIYAEMRSHGVPERIASYAATSLAMFRNAPDFGLGGTDDRLLAASARLAIHVHLERTQQRAAA